MTPQLLWARMLATVQDPRAGARWVMAQGLTAEQAWWALMLVAVLGGALGWITFAAIGQPPDQATATLFASPMQAAGIQAVIEGGAGLLLFFVGRFFGGTGSLADALALKAWMAVPLLVLQVVQLFGVLVSPLLYVAAGVAALGLNLWLLTLFTCELHGFRRPGLVVLGILGTSVLAGIPLVMFIAAMGGGLPDV